MNPSYALMLKMINNDLAQLHERCRRAFVAADSKHDEEFILGVQAVFGDLIQDIGKELKVVV